MKKLIFLIFIAAAIVFTSVFFISQSIASAQNSYALNLGEPGATPTAIPTATPSITLPTVTPTPYDQHNYPNIVTMFVAPETVDCVGSYPQTCLLIRYSLDEEWTYHYSGIEGFEYELGYAYVLSVEINEVENPPADGSSLRYTLIEIVTMGSPATSTPIPPCMPDSYVHDGICYPNPWTGEPQYGCFPLVDGGLVCIDPPDITVMPPTSTPSNQTPSGPTPTPSGPTATPSGPTATPSGPTATPTFGCTPDTYEHDGICYPNPWTGDTQYGCFPSVNGYTICIDPPDITFVPPTPTLSAGTPTPTPTPGCPSYRYEHDGICYPNPWTGDPQYGCFPTVDGYTICIDPPDITVVPPTPTPNVGMPTATPIPDCPPDAYEYEGICYPFQTAVLPTVTPTPQAPPISDVELFVLNSVQAELDCSFTEITVEIYSHPTTHAHNLSCVRGVGHSESIKIERFPRQVSASSEFTNRQEYGDSTAENFRCFPAFTKEGEHSVAEVTTFTWHVDNWLISIRSFHDTAHGSANSIGLSEKVYEAAIRAQMIEQCPAQPQSPTVTINHPSGAPGSVFVLEGSGFAPDREIAVSITGTPQVIYVQTDSDGSFVLLLLTNDWDSGIYELSLPTTSEDANVAAGNIAVTIDESLPQRERPETISDDTQQVTITTTTNQNDVKIFLPFLQQTQ